MELLNMRQWGTKFKTKLLNDKKTNIMYQTPYYSIALGSSKHKNNK